MMSGEDDIQILVIEYRFLCDQLANIQRISERQETVFITLVTAVISALLILGTAIQAGFGELQVVHVGELEFFLFAIFGQVGLIIIGIYIQISKISLQNRSDKIKYAINLIRDKFYSISTLYAEIYNQHQLYDSFLDQSLSKNQYLRNKRDEHVRLTTGFISTITVINSLIGVTLFNNLFLQGYILDPDIQKYSLSGCIGFILLFVIQIVVFWIIYKVFYNYLDKRSLS